MLRTNQKHNSNDGLTGGRDILFLPTILLSTEKLLSIERFPMLPDDTDSADERRPKLALSESIEPEYDA